MSIAFLASITRRAAARVIRVHASTLEAVADAAIKREQKAWDNVDATEAEIVELEKLADLRRADATAQTTRASNVCIAVAAELDSLPFINK